MGKSDNLATNAVLAYIVIKWDFQTAAAFYINLSEITSFISVKIEYFQGRQNIPVLKNEKLCLLNSKARE